jgi:anti-sigma28 factor (negative regulator of flagellin synthesis)
MAAHEEESPSVWERGASTRAVNATSPTAKTSAAITAGGTPIRARISTTCANADIRLVDRSANEEAMMQAERNDLDAALAEIRKVRETAERLANGDYPTDANHIRVLAGMIRQLAEQVERLASAAGR